MPAAEVFAFAPPLLASASQLLFAANSELDLRNNPIQKAPNYRLETIANMPSLTLLDGVEVTAQERVQASALFADQAVQPLLTSASASSPSASAADAIFGEELNEQLMIQEQISAKRKEDEEKRCVSCVPRV